MGYWVGWQNSRGQWELLSKGQALQDKLKSTPTEGFDVRYVFSHMEYAAKAIIDVMLASRPESWLRFGVLDDHGNVVWAEDENYQAYRREWKEECYTIEDVLDQFDGEMHVPAGKYKAARLTINFEPQEEQMSDTTITAPLNVPREALIARLQDRKAEEIQKREDAAKAGAARRQALLDVVAQLTTDQVANLLDRHVRSNDPEGLAKDVQGWIDDKKFVSKDAAPTSTETTLDKLISVLEIASDKTIEVKPTDPVYPLL